MSFRAWTPSFGTVWNPPSDVNFTVNQDTAAGAMLPEGMFPNGGGALNVSIDEGGFNIHGDVVGSQSRPVGMVDQAIAWAKANPLLVVGGAVGAIWLLKK